MPTNSQDLVGKTIVIVGASTSLGRGAAIELSGCGLHRWALADKGVALLFMSALLADPT